MNTIIDILKKSNNDLLKNEGFGVDLFKTLKHDKNSLDVFLKHVVAEILTTSKKHLFCTSNEALVKKFSSIKNEGKTMLKAVQVPFRTSPRHNVLTWDLLKNKYASISGNDWQILNFIVVDENNVSILHRAIVALIKRVSYNYVV